MKQGALSYMARHPVAANLLMAIFLLGGFLFSLQVKQEVFPDIDLDIVQVSVPYPGASPEEVEQGLILSIEDEVRSLDGVKKVTSRAGEGSGVVSIELLRGANGNKLLSDVKNAVDRIQSFPEEAERPIVSLLEARRQVISLIVYGDQDTATLREMGEKVRDDLLATEGITLVELRAVRPYEIGVEVPQENLRAYNLTLGQIANTVRQTALELPGGAVKAPSGEVLLRTQERRDFASEFENIPIVSNPDGSKVFLSDIAQVIEGFEDSDQEAYFNGKPAIRVDVYRVGDQTPLDIAEKVNLYIAELNASLPEGINISPWDDRSELFRDRIHLLVRNAALGLGMVLLLLGLFLEPRLAFWVMIGIPISIVGSFLFIPFTGASINMISLFAFIVTLGIVVDDAIVVGEIIYQKREKGLPAKEAAVAGVKEIAGPVLFAVLTNIAAFTPLFLVPGAAGKLFMQIPGVTVAVFIVSLIESLFVLPSHLSHEHHHSRFWSTLAIPSVLFNKALKLFVRKVYKPSLTVALRWNYLCLALGIGLLMVCLGFVAGGYVQFSFLPRVDSDLVTCRSVMTFGVPLERAEALQEYLTETAQQVINENDGEKIVRGIYTQIGTPIPGGGPGTSPAGERGAHIVGVQVLLVPSDKREISGLAFANRWREVTAQLPAVETISFNATIGTTSGAPIDIQLSHSDRDLLEAASSELGGKIATYTGVGDIDNGVSLGKEQLSFTLTPAARSLGLTVRDLAQQVRHSFYGAEALRQQRGRNEVKVLVRLPETEREQIFTLEELILRTSDGGEIPLAQAAEVERGFAYTTIERADSRRKLSVTADVDERVANANEIVGDIQQNVLPSLLSRYPGLTYSLEGEQRDQAESLESLGQGFLGTLIVIFALLAIPFASYIQPLMVMLAIPFGIVGAVIGHLLLGYELSIISMFGIIALSGVVVNDSLVLVVTANRNRELKGMGTIVALRQAGMQRFRPIILTSVTTFCGLAPMIFETSVQARFLIPMAISLGFGILFSTGIILLIVPAAYLIAEQIRNRGRSPWDEARERAKRERKT